MSADPSTLVPIILIGLVLLVIAVWALMRLNSTTTVIDADTAKRDVLDEDATPAKRNQAFIDAAPAAVKDNFGNTSAIANTDTIAAAPESADAEAGASVAPTKNAKATTPPSPEAASGSSTAPKVAPQAPPPVPKVIEDGESKDDLSKLKGIGPKLVTRLEELGVTRFAEIAAWSDSDVETIDAQLGRFKGRITRDQWVEQAKLLISDDKDAYAEKFGKNG